MVPFLAPHRMPCHTASSRGTRDISITACLSPHRRSLWQGKHGPAWADSPHYSAAKESEQVTSFESPALNPSCTSVLHSQDDPSCADPTRGDAILPSIAAPY